MELPPQPDPTAVVDQAKADDPRELKKRIAELSAELKKAQQVTPSSTPAKTLTAEPALTEADRALLLRIAEGQDALLTQLLRPVDISVARDAVLQALDSFVDERLHAQAQERDAFLGLYEGKRLEGIRAKVNALSAPLPPIPSGRVSIFPARTSPPVHREAGSVHTPVGHASTGEAKKFGKLGGRILAVLVSAGPKRRDQLGVRCVARADAGHFGNILSELRAAGLIDSANRLFQATDAGRAVRPVVPLPGSLVDAWCAKLSGLEADIFRHIVAAYPHGVTRDRLGELTGKRSDAGHFGNCLSTLRGNGIVESTGRGSELRASAELFG